MKNYHTIRFFVFNKIVGNYDFLCGTLYSRKKNAVKFAKEFIKEHANSVVSYRYKLETFVVADE